MFKVNNKDTRMTPWRLSVVFIVNILTYFTFCSSVFIVNFEHVIIGWGMVVLVLILMYKY